MPSPSAVRLAAGDEAPGLSLLDDGGEAVSLDDLAAQGYAVLGVSPDEPAKLAEFRARDHLTIRLLSDPSRETLAAWGAYGEKTSYGKTVTGVIRSTFVVDADGRIEYAAYNVKATGHVAKLRRDLAL